MADALKKAAVWLGLVSDNNYAGSEYGADDVTQQVPRDDDRQQQAYAPQASSQAAPAAPVSRREPEIVCWRETPGRGLSAVPFPFARPPTNPPGTS